jgi:hypothetical protein
MPESELESKLPSMMIEEDAAHHPRMPQSSGANAWWIAAIAALLALAAAVYWWQRQTPAPAASSPAVAEAPPAPKSSEPAIRHPIDEARAAVGPSGEDRNQLPTLGESDSAVRAALGTLSGASGFERFFYPETIVRRLVATVDNLPRRSIAPQVMIARPVPGVFLVSPNDGKLLVNGDNSARYAPYVRLVDGIDTKAAVALYVRFYPWFQQAYQELGYPSGYFNDRLIDVIDHLLAAPEISGPVALQQPHVLYAFADPDLESLSAGQKIMLRMGNANAAHVKAKLRDLRHLLTGAKAELRTTPPG